MAATDAQNARCAVTGGSAVFVNPSPQRRKQMKDQFASFPSYLQWAYWTPTGAPLLPPVPQDILTRSLPSSVEVSRGGVLGALGQEGGTPSRAGSTMASGAGGGLLRFLRQPAMICGAIRCRGTRRFCRHFRARRCLVVGVAPTLMLWLQRMTISASV